MHRTEIRQLIESTMNMVLSSGYNRAEDPYYAAKDYAVDMFRSLNLIGFPETMLLSELLEEIARSHPQECVNACVRLKRMFDT